MTGQIHDTVLFQDKPYDLVSSDGELFDPFSFGFFPSMMHTACWRGYYCTYGVIAGKLALITLTIHTHNGNYPPLQDILPRMKNTSAIYDSLSVSIPYSGRILLGGDFIQEMYTHMGFKTPQSYHRVFQIAFAGGKLVETHDLSMQFAEIRRQERPDLP